MPWGGVSSLSKLDTSQRKGWKKTATAFWQDRGRRLLSGAAITRGRVCLAHAKDAVPWVVCGGARACTLRCARGCAALCAQAPSLQRPGAPAGVPAGQTAQPQRALRGGEQLRAGGRDRRWR
jgi:hypothetical protein